MMDFLLKIPFFPILWFLEYLPGFFRFTLAACILLKMLRDVYNYNRMCQTGVLRKPKDFTCTKKEVSYEVPFYRKEIPPHPVHDCEYCRIGGSGKL